MNKENFITLEICAPENVEDFDEIKDYLSKENVRIFVYEDGTWNIEFQTKLKENNKNKFQSDEESEGDLLELYSFYSISELEKYIRDVFDKGLHILPAYEEDFDDEE